MKKVYVAKTPINHDGEDFQPEDEIELSDEQAEPLLERGAIEDPKAVKEGKPPKRVPKKVAKK